MEWVQPLGCFSLESSLVCRHLEAIHYAFYRLSDYGKEMQRKQTEGGGMSFISLRDGNVHPSMELIRRC